MRAISLQDKQFKFATEHKVYCKNPKCSGHGVVFRTKDQDKKLCPNCNEWVFRNKKAELKYRLLERGVKIDN